MTKWKASGDQRRVYEDFSGGIVTDDPLRKMMNECLQMKNVTVSTKGGFEKRKGTELLDSGQGLNSESDIHAVVLYVPTNDCEDCGIYSDALLTGATNKFCIWYAAECNIQSADARDKIIFVEFDTIANATTFMTNWETKGTNEGWISNYSYSTSGISNCEQAPV